MRTRPRTGLQLVGGVHRTTAQLHRGPLHDGLRCRRHYVRTVRDTLDQHVHAENREQETGGQETRALRVHGWCSGDGRLALFRRTAARPIGSS